MMWSAYPMASTYMNLQPLLVATQEPAAHSKVTKAPLIMDVQHQTPDGRAQRVLYNLLFNRVILE